MRAPAAPIEQRWLSPAQQRSRAQLHHANNVHWRAHDELVAELDAVVEFAIDYRAEDPDCPPDDCLPEVLHERLLPAAGKGTPLISEHAAGELAPGFRIAEGTARALISDGCDLRYRLPGTWQRCIERDLPVWVARKTAVRTRKLTEQQCRWLDEQFASRCPGLPAGRQLALVDALVIEADTAAEAARVKAARAARYVAVRSNGEGGAMLYGQLDALDGHRLFATAERLKDILRLHAGLTDSDDVLRSKSVGLMAIPPLATMVLHQASGHGPLDPRIEAELRTLWPQWNGDPEATSPKSRPDPTRHTTHADRDVRATVAIGDHHLQGTAAGNCGVTGPPAVDGRGDRIAAAEPGADTCARPSRRDPDPLPPAPSPEVMGPEVEPGFNATDAHWRARSLGLGLAPPEQWAIDEREPEGPWEGSALMWRSPHQPPLSMLGQPPDALEPQPGPREPLPHLFGPARWCCAPITVPVHTLLPAVQLVVHVSEQTARDLDGVARVEGIGQSGSAPMDFGSLIAQFDAGRVRVLPLVDLDKVPGVDHYEIPASVRQAVLNRHLYEPFPGSQRPSRKLDLDHTQEWVDRIPNSAAASRDSAPPPDPAPRPEASQPTAARAPKDPGAPISGHRPAGSDQRSADGPLPQTRPDNLAPLGRRLHRAKTAGYWSVSQPEPGVLQWTSPLGERYVVDPDGVRKADSSSERPDDG